MTWTKSWWLAFAIIGLFFLLRSGGASALLPFTKIILPVAVMYFIINKSLKSLFGSGMQERKEMRGSRPMSEGPVIEICPECGHQIGPRGRCEC